MDSKYTTVILGNGVAAVEAIRTMREKGYSEDICVVTENKESSYNPMLTTYFAGGKIPYSNCFPFGSGFEFFEEHDIKLKLGAKVLHLDTREQIIETQKGERIAYDQCLIATGASPLLPPIPGINSHRVYTMRTMADALRMKSALGKGPKRALVVGASMVGVKVLELLYNAKAKVILADMADRICPLAASADTACIMEELLAKKGIELRFKSALQSIKDVRGGAIAEFQDGSFAKVDLIAMCIGVRPNTEFLDRALIYLDRGILVDEGMRTNIPNVYAAGDVAQGRNILTGKQELIGLWANARFQGCTAGVNMAGYEAKYYGNIPHNITHFMDMVFVGMGNMAGDKEQTFHDKDSFTHLVWKDGRLVGVNSVNDHRTAGIIKQALVNGASEQLTLEELCFPKVYHQNRPSIYRQGG